MTTVLCYISLLIIPVCSFLMGLYRRSGCKEMHARLGYTSELSLSGPQAWARAQQASSLRYMIVSVVLCVILVQVIQSVGDVIARKTDKRTR